MIWLARLLIREKWKRSLTHYGWGGCVTLALMLSLFGWIAAAAVVPCIQGPARLEAPSFLNYVWLAWIIAGLFLGKDLTWHVRLDRLKLFPVRGFVRLYLLGLLLSFVSFPLFVVFLALEIAVTVAAGYSFARSAALLAACGLIVTSVRMTVSLLRARICTAWALSKAAKFLGSTAILLTAGCAAAALAHPGPAVWLPGHQLGLVLTGADLCRPLLLLASIVLLLSIADFVATADITYSGMHGPVARGGIVAARGSLMLIHPQWPPPLWRISLLGWLRNGNARMLFAWGTLYGFFYLYYTKPDEAFDYVVFSWMVLIFHAYLRGNLLGVDQGAVWLYYVLPVPAGNSIRAKNQTLNAVQGCMVAAVLLPAVFHPVPGMDLPAWLRIVSLAVSSLLLGEISGALFSLHHPEPIERSSHFSGGMTPGALAIPALQVLFLAIFMGSTSLSRRYLSTAVFWSELTVVPGILWGVRTFLLPGYIQRTMLRDRRAIFARLAVFSS